MRRVLPVLLTVLALAVAGATPAAAKPGAKAKEWTVTIENLTGGQPLSPPLFVVHSRRADVWSFGEIASHGVAAIAEDANNAVLEQALPGAAGVRVVVTGAGGPIVPGASASYAVESKGRYDRLSLLTMLVNTNDAFTGLDSFRLRGKGWTRHVTAYDAGSERNNELAAFIPGPCCGNPFVRDPEGRPVSMHDGILGVGDLDRVVYGWTGPVATITVERT